MTHPGDIIEGNVLASVRLPEPTYPLREALPPVSLVLAVGL